MNKKALLIVLVIVLVITIIIAAILGFFYVKSKDNSEDSIEEFVYEVGDMYSNLKNTTKKIKINLNIIVSDEDLLLKLSESNYLKHELLEIVRDKTYSELDGKEGQDNLQMDIKNMLLDKFETDKILNVYFNEFIVD